jgi:hypothetical protein
MYSFSLILVYAYLFLNIKREPMPALPCALSFALLRFKLSANKYFLWIFIVVVAILDEVGRTTSKVSRLSSTGL